MNPDQLLVSTKFAPPRLGARAVPRKQLLDLLREGRHCTFALVTGSAGFGKTILLAQWRQELIKSGAEVAWLSLGQDDRQLNNFCAYALGALQRQGVAIEDDLPLEPGSDKWLDGVVAAVVEGTAAFGKELHLIVDDYHHVADPWAHKFMQRLLDHCPENLHIAIATRAAPPLAIARLRLRGQVVEVECAALPFDLEETRLFFSQNLGTLRLSDDELRLVHDVTSGWPASLQLVAIMLRNRPQSRATLRDLGWRSSDLQAWLAEDVMAHLPPELSQFMERLSVCRRFNAELAATVTEDAHAAALLQRAEDENLLIYRTESDDRVPWFRFHPLFGEFLSARMSRHGRPAVDGLHRRASAWFAQHGFLDEAVRHAVAAGELDMAVQVIVHAAPSTWSMGYVSRMIHLFDRLPQETLFAHPSLFFLGCLTYALTARPAQAERWLVQIRESPAVRVPAVSSKLALADATVALQRDDTKRVIDLLEPVERLDYDDPFLRHVHLLTLLTAYLGAGRHADGRRLLEANPTPPQERNTDMALIAEFIGTVSAPLSEGRLAEAAQAGAAFLARVEGSFGRRCVPAILCAGVVADAFYELDRVDDARKVLANRSSTLQASTPDVMIRAAQVRVHLERLQAGPDAALAFAQAQAAYYRSLGLDRAEAAMLAESVRILLAERRPGDASEALKRLELLAQEHRQAQGFRAEIPAIAAMAWARFALREKRGADALAHAGFAGDFAVRHRRPRMQVQARVLHALALDDLGRLREADAAMSEAVRDGCPMGMVRSFIDEGPAAAAVLARLRKASGWSAAEAAHLDRLIGDAASPPAPGGTTAPASAEAAAAPGGPGRSPLTPRELEILKLVGQAMSGKRIAQTLNITPETVKWNIRNILTKLRLNSRYDALLWARRQGLIE